MRFKLISSAAIACSVICQLAFALPNSIQFKNERGSILELRALPDNKIEGYFITAVASKSCPQAVHSKRPVIGYLVGNTLSFSVAYPQCGSVLSISGHFTKDQKAIDTISILNKQAEDIIHEGPGARFIGHDTYQRMAEPTQK